MNFRGTLQAALLCAGTSQAVQGSTLAECRELTDDETRLACYDSVAGRDAQTGSRIEPPVASGVQEDEFVSARLKEEEANANNRFVIIPHNRNYLLPITYNSNINEEAWKEQHPGDGMDQAEAKFQISFKAIIWQDILGRDIDLWGAYTQENWWQVYNTDTSSPFRETDYQPELILSMANNWHFLGVHNTRLALALNHQSNGSSEPQSRSWNTVCNSW